MPVAIVTGSDSDIGKACAVALASAVMDVGITWHTDPIGEVDVLVNNSGTGRSTPEATAGDTADHARLAE